jgi:hypothetical protein
MESHVEAVSSAGSEAHGLDKDGLGEAVSVNSEVDNLSSYLSEYIGLYGDSETVLERPWHEQMFYAVAWATNSRRVDFSNGGQEMIADEKWRRETGLRPEDRGDSKAAESGADEQSTEGDTEATETASDDEWTCEAICSVHEGEPYFYPPESSSVCGPIDGIPGEDPEKFVA